MYAWIFAHLPGPLWVRVLTSIVLIAGAVLLLMEVVFPWAALHFPSGVQVTVAE
ncbi:hypothetical protein [Kocuria sp. SM24M-10]|uniref:hypothetical protein n=1 Tax=Kocuria sp. SM24M-10 TaxID=1660349 RepID=UPI000649C08C|nr:hypothetical protein [Kocuria sp. SM24M-10]KLU11554.1 membrane protein [Kocuria sp. SM24M-10]